MKKILIAFLLFYISLNAKETSIDEMISQMIIVGFSGDNSEDKWVRQISIDIRNKKIGGVILFSKNIKSPKQIKSLITYLKKQNKSKLPLFFGIDQEGGKVQRLKKSNGFNDYLSAQEIASKFTLFEASQQYEKLSDELYNYGFNLNFAPVVDINVNQSSPVIGKKGRSYSDKEEIVYAYASIFIRAMNKYKILNALKHFPGHGSSFKDSHKGFTDITKTWEYKELKPYYDFIKYKKVDMVMVGHLSHKGFDKNYPATLSKNIVQGILRDKLKYEGVVISDDMHMKAITDNYTLEKSIVQAINAGVDILLFSTYFYNNSNIPKTVHSVVKQAIKEGLIKKSTIETSYKRIKKLKEGI